MPFFRLIFQERHVLKRMTALGYTTVYTELSYPKHHGGRDPLSDGLKLEDIELPNGQKVRGVSVPC